MKRIFSFLICSLFIFASATPSWADEPDKTVIHAKTLWKEFDDNAFAADEKYAGREILIKGEIKSIKKNVFTNLPVIELEVSSMHSVDCQMQVNDQKKAITPVEKLKKGEEVVIKGKVKNYLTNSVQIEDCQLVEQP